MEGKRGVVCFLLWFRVLAFASDGLDAFAYTAGTPQESMGQSAACLLQAHHQRATVASTVTEHDAVEVFGKTDADPPCASCNCSFMGRDGTPTNCDIEINSRAMVEQWVNQNATTLEVGARYGSVSCAIAQKQNQSGRQVSVDADHRVWDALERNRAEHKCNFHIVKGLLGKRDGKVFENGFGTHAGDNLSEAELASDTGVVVPHFSLDDVEKQFDLKFDTANFDCEGCAASVFADFPHLKTQLKLIILEQHNEEEANVVADLLTNGWSLVATASRQRVLVRDGVDQRTDSTAATDSAFAH